MLMGETEQQRLLQLIRAQAAEVLGCPMESVGPSQAFADLGFDSLTALELADRVGALTGLALPGTLAFDYPNPASLAAYLAAQLAPGQGEQTGAETTHSRSHEPIAIVAMACRLPGGVSTPEQLWRLLAQGEDGIGPFPTDRGWPPELFHPDPDHPHTSYVRHGGFLADPGGFDPAFFGLSPREALATDPQQRIMLEVCWEALERGGIDPSALRETRSGVYTGVIGNDYAPRGDRIPAEVAGFLLAGNATSVVSGRIAYLLGTQGPAVTLDTACSSSLVALHLAVQALRAGECSLALAGGVTVLAQPTVFTEFSRQRGLAPDGRCKSFAEAADGTGWAEGAVVLVLERLSQARRHHRPVLAVIRGSAVNSDGASNGLTAPNGPAQQRLIADALADAGLGAEAIDAVEAHGTGTRLGDPIEAQALQAAYGGGRERPLWLGSVKSNLGHTQAAAGAAGVMKMVLALQHEMLPRTLHVDKPSPFVDWSAGPLRLLTQEQPWPAGEVVRRAAVSSFGISGTNAHVILEEAPAPLPAALPRRIPLLLSGRSEAAVREQATRWRGHLATHDWESIAAAATGRSVFEWRAAAFGPADLAEPEVVKSAPGKLALVFAGQGAQRRAMGSELAAAWPEFAAEYDAVCAELDKHLDRPIRSVIDADDGLLDQTGYTQPALFAIEVALARLLLAWGVRPSYLIGHSIGELAAAHVSGALSLPDACRLVAARAALMQALPEGGAMIAVEADEAEVAALPPGQWSLAAVNGPRSVVLSGAEAEVAALAEGFAEQGRRTTRLRVSHAFHSPLMEPMLAVFAQAERDLVPQPGAVPVVSNLTGLPVTTFEAGHWTRHVRAPVRFAQGVELLAAEGVTWYLEIGPGVLTALLPGVAVPLLRAGRPEPEAVLAALAQLHLQGMEVDWAKAAGAQVILPDLPTYPFQRKRFWLSPAGGPALRRAIGVPAADGTESLVLTGKLSLRTQPWLADHRVGVATVVPGAFFAELALKAAEQTETPVLAELLLRELLPVPVEEGIELRVVVDAPADGLRPFAIHARREAQPWTCYATGLLGPARPADAARLKVWPPPGAMPLAVDGLYDELAAHGYHYGPAFQGLQRAWRRGEETFAEVSTIAEPGEFGLHPALLDAALHTLSLARPTEAEVMVPFSFSGVSLYATGATTLRVRLTRQADRLTLAMADPAGMPVATIRDVQMRPMMAQRPAPATGFQLSWLPIEPSLGEAVEAEYLHATTAAQTLTLIQDRLAGQSRLALLTRDAEQDPAQASVWGLARAAQSEHPGRLTLIDLDAADPSEELLAAAVATGEPQLAIRDGRLLVPRLTRLAETGPATPPALKGTVLITGGTGALGRLVARHLTLQWGVPSLLLAGRKGMAGQGAAELAGELTGLGAAVRVVACDVGDRQAVAQLLSQVPPEHPLVAVIHLAGVLDDGMLESQTPSRIEAVMRAKAAGAWHLHELTGQANLEAFVLFSSAAAILGSPGQAGYAAANAYLDALAAHRRACGLPGQAIAWGLWETEGGMAAEVTPAGVRRMRGVGLTPLTAQQGLTLFDEALRKRIPALVAMNFTPPMGGADPEAIPAVLRHLIRPATRRAGAADPAGQAAGGLAQTLAGMPASQRETLLRELVVEQAAKVLGHASASELDVTRALPDLGFDSLTAVELRNRLAAATGLRLAATLVFDHPAIDSLVAHLLGELVPQEAASAIGLIEELTRLEAGVAKLTIDEVARKRLTDTLTSLLSKVDSGRRDVIDAAGDDFHDLLTG
ncbi:SDR family NAD(P)-dependent oxidoreductase [Rhizocola hellebori]|uniref:SDR family NAD(P)-dependent oxidoreductase n=1 Tax=Rhizocola hellebori TaxID=1392758 RepID=UPI004032A527